MVKGKLVRITAATVASVGLGLGMLGGVAGASAGTITTTGPESSNIVTSKTTSHMHVNNHTNLLVGNLTLQGANTGTAHTTKNTNAGNAASGNAANANGTSTGGTIANAMPAMSSTTSTTMGSNTGAITNTGPDSTNVVKSKSDSSVKVDNHTNVAVVNITAQEATSGDASVTKNTNGGSATTGSAMNSNVTTTTLTITN